MIKLCQCEQSICVALFHCHDKDPHTQTDIDSNVEHQFDTPTDEQNVSFRWMLHIHSMHYIHLALNGANRYAHRNANNIKRNFHTLYTSKKNVVVACSSLAVVQLTHNFPCTHLCNKVILWRYFYIRLYQ